MADDDHSERLRRLEERIAAVRGEEKAGPSAGDKYTQANVAWRMVTELVAGIVIGLGIGLGLDALLGTKPFLLVLFILLGLVAGIKTMLRTAGEIQARLADASADEKQADTSAGDERD